MVSLYPRPRRLHLGGLALIALAVIIVAGGVGGFFALRSSRVELDPQTLCPTSGPQERTVLLLDVSDPLSLKQQAALENLLRDLQNPATSREAMLAAGVPGGTRYVERYGELVAYLLETSLPELEPFLRICNPGNPDEIAALDQMTRSKRRAVARWRNFTEEIKEKFAGQSLTGTQTASPLLETLALIAEREVDSVALRASGKAIPVRLIMFSDMIQHSDELSHFRNMPEVSNLLKNGATAPLAADLTGVEVIIFYLRRPDYASVQTPQHYKWWRNAIQQLGGRLIYIGPI